MALTPYPWQQRDLEKLRANNWTGLLAIEAGGGKSLAATLVIRESNANVVLILAPKSTHLTAWAPTVAELTGREVRVIGNQNKATKAALADFEWGVRGVYIATPQFMTHKNTDISTWAGDLLIVDEIHQVATARSAGQRRLSGYNENSDGEPLAARFTHRLALSGTPVRQHLSNMWSTMRFLWPSLDQRGEVAYKNYIAWQMDRLVSKDVYTANRDQYGNAKTVKQFTVEKNPGQLISEMPCVVMHKRREYCCDAHPNGFLSTEKPQVIDRVVELHPKQKKAIRDLEAFFLAWLDSGPLVVDLSLVQKQRIRQVCLGVPDLEFYTDPVSLEDKTRIRWEDDCASPFIDETLHILSNLGDDEPVIIYLESQKFAEIVVKRLNAAGITASEYSGKRKADLSRFGKDYRVLVGVTSAIGTGTDGLQHVSNTEIWLEVPVSLTTEAQTQARLERMGGRQVQRYRVLDSEGIAEGRISDSVLKRLMLNQSLRVAS